MKNNIPDLPLTDAALQALESLTDEYRRRILEEADSRALRIGGVTPEISVRDIMESADKVTSARSSSREQKKELFMQVYSMIGAFFAVFGIGLLIKGRFPSQMDMSEQIAVIITMTGVLLALSPIFLRRMLKLMEATRSSRETSPVDATSVFITRWQTIEMLLRKHLKNQGHSAAREPFSTLMTTLQKRGLLSDVDISMLKRLLSLRNQVVHERGFADKRMLEQAIEISGDLIEKLRSK